MLVKNQSRPANMQPIQVYSFFDRPFFVWFTQLFLYVSIYTFSYISPFLVCVLELAHSSY